MKKCMYILNKLFTKVNKVIFMCFPVYPHKLFSTIHSSPRNEDRECTTEVSEGVSLSSRMMDGIDCVRC